MTEERTKNRNKSRPKLIAENGITKPDTASNAQEFYNQMEVDTLARTMWGEARGEGDIGLTAVAHVVLNRVARAKEHGRYWWGNSIIQVCQKPYQFSCWNRSDPSYKKLIAVDERNLDFATCIRIARRAVIGTIGEDITKGATHYHADYVDPYWAKGQEPTITIGRHIFYNLENI